MAVPKHTHTHKLSSKVDLGKTIDVSYSHKTSNTHKSRHKHTHTHKETKSEYPVYHGRLRVRVYVCVLAYT